jgi:hypothetical protein
MIDGGDSNDPSVGGLIQQINNPDTVSEFKLITNQFLAEYGRSSGSVVNIVTKAGTNEFHGSGFWRYNGAKLNSRSNLDERIFPKAPFRVENQVAGTFGGRIVKDKTFFFVSLMKWTDRQSASGANITGAPTAAGQTVLRQLAGTRPQIATLLANLPAAQVANGPTVSVTAGGQSYQVQTGTLSGAAPNKLDDWQGMGRVDHRFSDKHIGNLRYNVDDRVTISGQSVPDGLTALNPVRRQSWTSTINSSFSAAVLNEFRLSYQRQNSVTNAANAAAEGLPSIEVAELGLTGFNAAADRTAIGLAVNLPQSSTYNNYQLTDNFSVLRGSHSMKFGLDFRRVDQFSVFNPTLRGRLSYVSLQDYVDDVAQTATINSPLAGVPIKQAYRYYDYFFYVQDEWKATSRLTMTYGLRYETPGNAYGYLQELNDKVVASYNNPAFRVDPLPKRDRNNWAPRFGFNYRFGNAPGMLGMLTGDNKLVLRGGYSRSYDLIFNNIALNVFSAFPFTVITTLPGRTPNSFATIDGIRAGRIQPTVTNPGQITRTIVDTGFRSPYSEQFSVQLQRELASNWVLSLGYVGTKGTALFQSLDGNPVVSASGVSPVVRRDPARGVIRHRANSASSIYHSLQASIEKRLSSSFSMAAHYTWSSFIDYASEVFNASVRGDVAVPQNSADRAADRGRSTYDRPHRFSINGVYEIPFFRQQPGAIGRILGGWQANAFLTFQAGAPYTALDGGDPGLRLSGIDGLVGNSIRANVNTNLDLSSMSTEAIFDAGGRNLFSRVSVASPFGNIGRNTLRADGIGNLDFGLFKNVKIMENHRLQIRSEFFNISNTRNFGIPEARVNNAGFGNQWNTDGGNRRVVMGLRYTF